MKIGINGFELVVSRFGIDRDNLPIRAGSGGYIFALVWSLYRLDEVNEYTIFLPDEPTSDLPKIRKNWNYVIVKAKKLWTLYALSKYFLLEKPKIDVFFSPTHYLSLYVPYPSIISILDLSFLKFKDNFTRKDFWQLKLWTQWSASKCRKIFTISEASKNDILKEYGLPENKVAVTYLGVNEIKNATINKLNMNSVLQKYGVSSKFILFVGTIQPRKNITRLIEAFSKLSDRKDLQLIIVGKPGWMFEEIYSAPKKYGVEDSVKFLDNVTNEELTEFYKNAQCFILPSLYEGFGLPILEAMQNGCPVITSKVSSMPEAGGDAALYIDPNSVKDIKEKIEMVLSDPKLKDNMVEKGYRHVKKFSWEKTARETLKVLEEVVRKDV